MEKVEERDRRNLPHREIGVGKVEERNRRDLPQ